MRLNTMTRPRTHEGAPAARISPEQQLRRLTLTSMLWEDNFYVDGQSSGDLVAEYCRYVPAETIADLAVECRNEQKLRHIPLWLIVSLAKNGGNHLLKETINKVVQRPDEMCELLSLYWKNGKVPIPNGMKKGLAACFSKFDEYQLAKWNRDTPIKLRDVMFLVHPKPKTKKDAAVFKRLAENNLKTPDTWETRLSAGKDKKKSFEELLMDNKLGYMALLMNLRNMIGSGVNTDLIEERLIGGAPKSKALPFRFLTALKHAPSLLKALDYAMILSLENMVTIPGRTSLLIDVSSSMDCLSSSKSEATHLDRAIGLAILATRIFLNLRVFTFSSHVVEVPAFKGLALKDAIVNSQHHGWTDLGGAVVDRKLFPCERLIVISDEQSHNQVPNPSVRGYMINIANMQHGVGYGVWHHIDGFSERIFNYIAELEKNNF